MHFDVFNGDADGIIALLQLRLAEPKQSTLITGVKRDIQLLQQVDGEIANSVTVLDISMEKNIESLNTLLSKNIDIFYVDHHRSGDIPQSNSLQAIINTDANTCTSLLVNDYLQGKYELWAIAAAFGDNMFTAAKALSEKLQISKQEQAQLQALGTYINYNGYGRTVEDLHIAPAQLFKQLLAYDNPFDLIAQPNSIYHQLANAYQSDMHKAQQSKVLYQDDSLHIVELDDAPWSRRVSGVFGNELANNAPDKAHAVLTLNHDNSYLVSLRAPLNNKQGAGDLCASFATGGGRAAAAGINQLPQENLGKFIQLVSNYYH